jgi:hypothetical protein
LDVSNTKFQHGKPETFKLKTPNPKIRCDKLRTLKLNTPYLEIGHEKPKIP